MKNLILCLLFMHSVILIAQNNKRELFVKAEYTPCKKCYDAKYDTSYYIMARNFDNTEKRLFSFAGELYKPLISRNNKFILMNVGTISSKKYADLLNRNIEKKQLLKDAYGYIIIDTTGKILLGPIKDSYDTKIAFRKDYYENNFIIFDGKIFSMVSGKITDDCNISVQYGESTYTINNPKTKETYIYTSNKGYVDIEGNETMLSPYRLIFGSVSPDFYFDPSNRYNYKYSDIYQFQKGDSICLFDKSLNFKLAYNKNWHLSLSNVYPDTTKAIKHFYKLSDEKYNNYGWYYVDLGPISIDFVQKNLPSIYKEEKWFKDYNLKIKNNPKTTSEPVRDTSYNTFGFWTVKSFNKREAKDVADGLNQIAQITKITNGATDYWKNNNKEKCYVRFTSNKDILIMIENADINESYQSFGVKGSFDYKSKPFFSSNSDEIQTAILQKHTLYNLNIKNIKDGWTRVEKNMIFNSDYNNCQLNLP